MAQILPTLISFLVKLPADAFTYLSYNFRKNERKKEGAPTWDEQKAEVDHRERIRQRQRQEGTRKKPIIWDDADERKCQERYRKKYSHH